MKFAHLGDCHLGGWRFPELQELSMQSFSKAIDISIKENVDFILIAGDLFDSAYPSIEVLKKTFAEFKKIKEANIPCFIIAGSHDYSVSGKTFLDVLEEAGFCKNVADFDNKGDLIVLNPSLCKGVAIYGYPGKKAGLEVPELRKIKLNDAPGMFKILMLHTTIDKAKGTLPIDAIETEGIPSVDYVALGHLHMDFQYNNFVYPGPIFPNNFQELEDLKQGSFYIVDTDLATPLQKIDLNVKEIVVLEIEITNSLLATEKIINEINKRDVEDKILLLRIKGELKSGKNSDIKFTQIEEFARQKKAYFLLKNTHDLKVKEFELQVEVENAENMEEETIKIYSEQNPASLNELILPLMDSLEIEKQEGETSENFNNRLIEATKKVLNF